jgi:probable F420-dependent oxidoreductase
LKFGVCVPNFGNLASVSAIRAAARAAEEFGLDSVWVTDHLVVPSTMKNPYGTTYELISTLAYLTSITNRVTLGSSALILPLRNPVVVAKQAATIDQLSNGRLVLGVGFGWLLDEFNYLRADYKHRYSAVKAGVRLIRSLWLDDPVNYGDGVFDIKEALADPKPVQKPSIPIYIAGNTRRAFEIAATIGDGWHPVGLSPEEVAQSKETTSSLKSRNTFEVVLRSPFKLGSKITYKGASNRAMYTIQGTEREIVGSIQRFKESGVTHLVMNIISDSLDDYIHSLEFVGKQLIPSFKT